MNIILGIFFILHGLVHLLYFGQSTRLFQLKSEMVWPDGSWVFVRFSGKDSIRFIASIVCMWAAVVFVAAGIALFLTQSWWHPVVISASAFSTVLFIVFWDGKVQSIASKGLVAVLINLVIMITLLVFKWPTFVF